MDDQTQQISFFTDIVLAHVDSQKYSTKSTAAGTNQGEQDLQLRPRLLPRLLEYIRQTRYPVARRPGLKSGGSTNFSSPGFTT